MRFNTPGLNFSLIRRLWQMWSNFRHVWVRLERLFGTSNTRMRFRLQKIEIVPLEFGCQKFSSSFANCACLSHSYGKIWHCQVIKQNTERAEDDAKLKVINYFFIPDSQTSSAEAGSYVYVPGSFAAKQKSRPSIITATIAASFDNSILQVGKEDLSCGEVNRIYFVL